MVPVNDRPRAKTFLQRRIGHRWMRSEDPLSRVDMALGEHRTPPSDRFKVLRNAERLQRQWVELPIHGKGLRKLGGRDLQNFAFHTLRDLPEAKKILWKLVPVRKRLIHEKVLPFRGVDATVYSNSRLGRQPEHHAISRVSLQRLKAEDGSFPPLHYTCIRCSESPLKLLQIAKGFQYLHSLDFMH